VKVFPPPLPVLIIVVLFFSAMPIFLDFIGEIGTIAGIMSVLSLQFLSLVD
jgi:hypothetical protein